LLATHTRKAVNEEHPLLSEATMILHCNARGARLRTGWEQTPIRTDGTADGDWHPRRPARGAL
jgi:hypothetical protein